MAKDVINENDEQTVVREDTAKAYRGTIWILFVVAMVLGTAAILFFVFFGGSVGDGDLKSPKEIEQKRQTGESR